MADTELARRLEKLERDNRPLKGIGIAALVLAGGADSRFVESAFSRSERLLVMLVEGGPFQ